LPNQSIYTTAAPLLLSPLDDEHYGESELQPLLLGKSSKRGFSSFKPALCEVLNVRSFLSTALISSSNFLEVA
jgi:hypothetical protein